MILERYDCVRIEVAGALGPGEANLGQQLCCGGGVARGDQRAEFLDLCGDVGHGGDASGRIRLSRPYPNASSISA